MEKRKLAIGLGISIIILSYVAVKTDWSLMLEIFKRINWFWLAISFGIYLVNYWLRTMRFQSLLNLGFISRWALFGVTGLYGMNLYLMPAKLGEATYPLLLKNRFRVSLTEGTATLIVARIFDFFTIALFLPVVLVVFWRQLHPWIIIGSIFFITIVICGIFLLLWFLRSQSGVAKIKQEQRLTQPLIKKLVRILDRLVASLQVIDKSNRYLAVFIQTLCIWLCVYLNFYFLVISLGQTLSFFHIIVVSIIMVPITLIPVQGFANLGTHEIGWTAAFAFFGYSESTALTIAFSTHILLLVEVLILGFLGLFILNIVGTPKSS